MRHGGLSSDGFHPSSVLLDLTLFCECRRRLSASHAAYSYCSVNYMLPSSKHLQLSEWCLHIHEFTRVKENYYYIIIICVFSNEDFPLIFPYSQSTHPLPRLSLHKHQYENGADIWGLSVYVILSLLKDPYPLLKRKEHVKGHGLQRTTEK